MMPLIRPCFISEGLVIGENIHMGHLKGCLIDFVVPFSGWMICQFDFGPAFFLYRALCRGGYWLPPD